MGGGDRAWRPAERAAADGPDPTAPSPGSSPSASARTARVLPTGVHGRPIAVRRAKYGRPSNQVVGFFYDPRLLPGSKRARFASQPTTASSPCFPGLWRASPCPKRVRLPVEETRTLQPLLVNADPSDQDPGAVATPAAPPGERAPEMEPPAKSKVNADTVRPQSHLPKFPPTCAMPLCTVFTPASTGLLPWKPRGGSTHPSQPLLSQPTQAAWTSATSAASETATSPTAGRSAGAAAVALRDLIGGRWREHGPRGELEALFAANAAGAEGMPPPPPSAPTGPVASPDAKRIATLQRRWASLLQHGAVSVHEYTEAQAALLGLTRAATRDSPPPTATDQSTQRGRGTVPGAPPLVRGNGAFGSRDFSGDGEELVVWSENSNPFLEPLLETLLRVSPESDYAPHRAAQALAQARRAVVGIVQTYGPADERLQVPLQILLTQVGALLARLTTSRTTILRTVASAASLRGPPPGAAFASPLQSVADACVLPGLQSLAWPPQWGDDAQWLVPLRVSPTVAARRASELEADDESGIASQPARLLGSAARGYVALVDAVQRVRAMEDALHTILNGLVLVEDMAFVVTHHLAAAARGPGAGSAPHLPPSTAAQPVSPGAGPDTHAVGTRPSRSHGGRAYHYVESRLHESTALQRTRKAQRAEQIRLVRRASRQNVARREETGRNIPQALQGCRHSAWAADLAAHKTWWRSAPLTAHFLAVALRVTEPLARWRRGEDEVLPPFSEEGEGSTSEALSDRRWDGTQGSVGAGAIQAVGSGGLGSEGQAADGTWDGEGETVDEPPSPQARRAARLREMSKRGANVAEVFSHLQRDPALLASVLAATGTKHRARLAEALALQVYQDRIDPAGLLALSWCAAALQLHRAVEVGAASQATDYLRTPAERAALRSALHAVHRTATAPGQEGGDPGILAGHWMHGSDLGSARSPPSDLQLLVRAAARGPALAGLRTAVAKALAVCIHARLCGDASRPLDTGTEPAEPVLPRPEAAVKLAQLSQDTRGALACAEALVMALERVHESPRFPRLLCSLLRIARAVAGPQGPSHLLWGVVVDEMLAVSHVDVAYAMGLVGVRGQGPVAEAAVHRAAGHAFCAARAAEHGAQLAAPCAQLFEADAGAKPMLQRVAAVCRALSAAVSHLFGPDWAPARERAPLTGIASSVLEARRRRVGPVSASLVERLLSLPHLLPAALRQKNTDPTSTAEDAVAAKLGQHVHACRTNSGAVRRAGAILQAASGPSPREQQRMAGESQADAADGENPRSGAAPAWDRPHGAQLPLPLLRSGVTLASRALQGNSEATQSAFQVISGVGSQLHDAAQRAVDWQGSRFASRFRIHDLLLLWDCTAACLARKHEEWEDEATMQATSTGSAQEFPPDLRALRSVLRTTRPWITGLAVRAHHHGRGSSRKGQKATWSPKRGKYRDGMADVWYKSLRRGDPANAGHQSRADAGGDMDGHSSEDEDDSHGSECESAEGSDRDFDAGVLDDAPEAEGAAGFLVHIGYDGQARHIQGQSLHGASRAGRRVDASPESPRPKPVRDNALGARTPSSPRLPELAGEHRGAPHRGPIVVCLRGSNRGCWAQVVENEAGAASGVGEGLERLRLDIKRLQRGRTVVSASPRDMAAALGEAVEDCGQPISTALRNRVAEAVTGECDPLRGRYSLWTGLQRAEDAEWLQSTPGCLMTNVKERALPLTGRPTTEATAGPEAPTQWEARSEALTALDGVSRALLGGRRHPVRSQDAATAREVGQGGVGEAVSAEEDAVGQAVRSTHPDLKQHAETVGHLAGTMVSADAAIRRTHARADALEREVADTQRQLECAMGSLLRMLRGLGVPIGDRRPPAQAPVQRRGLAGPSSEHSSVERSRRAVGRRPRGATSTNQLATHRPTKLATAPSLVRHLANMAQPELAIQAPLSASLHPPEARAGRAFTAERPTSGRGLFVVAEPASDGPEYGGSRTERRPPESRVQHKDAMGSTASAELQPAVSENALWAELAQWEDLSGASGDTEDDVGSFANQAAPSPAPPHSGEADPAPFAPALAAARPPPTVAASVVMSTPGTGLQAPPATPVPQQLRPPSAAAPGLHRAPSVDSERSMPPSVASSAASSGKGCAVLRKGGGIRDGSAVTTTPSPRLPSDAQGALGRDHAAAQSAPSLQPAPSATEEDASHARSGEATGLQIQVPGSTGEPAAPRLAVAVAGTGEAEEYPPRERNSPLVASETPDSGVPDSTAVGDATTEASPLHVEPKESATTPLDSLNTHQDEHCAAAGVGEGDGGGEEEGTKASSLEGEPRPLYRAQERLLEHSTAGSGAGALQQEGMNGPVSQDDAASRARAEIAGAVDRPREGTAVAPARGADGGSENGKAPQAAESGVEASGRTQRGSIAALRARFERPAAAVLDQPQSTPSPSAPNMAPGSVRALRDAWQAAATSSTASMEARAAVGSGGTDSATPEALVRAGEAGGQDQDSWHRAVDGGTDSEWFIAQPDAEVPEASSNKGSTPPESSAGISGPASLQSASQKSQISHHEEEVEWPYEESATYGSEGGSNAAPAKYSVGMGATSGTSWI